MNTMKRNRIRKSSINTTVEKVDLSHLKAFKVKKRNPVDANWKRERLLAFEVRDMFRSLTVDNILFEKGQSRLAKVETRPTISKVEKTVSHPTSYRMVKDTVLGMYRIGQNFVRTQIEVLEVQDVIDWNTIK